MSMLIKAEDIIVDNTEYNSDEADDIHLALEDSGGENYHQNYQEQQDQDIQDEMASPRHNGSGGMVSAPNTPSSKNADPLANKSMMENEKRIRREIANSNERRRMQSINAGFQSLRSLLPRHEGEKLSKAAILQQTAQYILDLEREKTTLLSQNSQLKRQHCQHDGTGTCNGGGGNNISTTTGNKLTADNDTNTTVTAAGALKKRKLADNVISMQTISDSSDEGLGSMSPEPMTLIATTAGSGTVSIQQLQSKPATAYISSTAKEVIELRTRLENERKRRHVTEERLSQLERQMYQTQIVSSNVVGTQYIQREVIEHTDNLRDDDIIIMNEQDHHHHQQQQQHHLHHRHQQQTQTLKIDPIKLQMVEIESLPSVGQTQVVVCSSIEEMQDDEAEIINDMNIREEVIMTDDNTEIVEVPSRLQPILEAAIKAEPKVEVERINATISKIKGETAKGGDCDGSGGANGSGKRMYLTSTSRQNLETIVEAIRHLEGDHLFGDNIATIEQQQQHKKLQQQQQESPLALTTAVQATITPKQPNQQLQKSQRNLTKDLSPFLQLKKPTNITIISGSCKTLNSSNSSNNSNHLTTTNSNNTNNINLSNNQKNMITTTTTGAGALSSTSIRLPLSSSSSSLSSASSTTTVSTLKGEQIVPTSIITATQLKQCRPGVIVAKQTS